MRLAKRQSSSPMLTFRQTFLQVSIFAANMSPGNFTDPTSFVPERWIAPHGRYTDDKRGSVQPFSLGPRACIGKS